MIIPCCSSLLAYTRFRIRVFKQFEVTGEQKDDDVPGLSKFKGPPEQRVMGSVCADIVLGHEKSSRERSNLRCHGRLAAGLWGRDLLLASGAWDSA